MLKNETILITGGTGYLGSALVSKCFELNAKKIIVLKRSHSSVERLSQHLSSLIFYNIDGAIDIKNIFKENNITTLIHCATHYAKNNSPLNEVIKTNIEYPLQILEIATHNGLKTFINTDTFLNEKISPYAYTKKQFLEELKKFHSQLSCINMCLEYFYGPFDDPHKLLTYLIRTLKKLPEKIELTAGEQKRDFIYIQDVVNAYATLFTSPFLHQKGFYHFEVGTNQSISIKNLALLIQDLLNAHKTKLLFGAIPYRPYEIFDSKVHTEPLQALGWKPLTSLVEGLKIVIESEKGL